MQYDVPVRIFASNYNFMLGALKFGGKLTHDFGTL